ncbi:MAG TPA: preprotein translocase subunit SecG [Polyangiaceae bacterium]|nr:preprotein translocase subunit SecG [Polyangiaceae bacterium]
MADFLHTPFTVLHIMACAFLILVILIQPGKSGGLGALGGGGAQQVFGGSGAGNFLTKTTWATAAIFFFTSISLAYLSSSTDESMRKHSQALQKQHEQNSPLGPIAPTKSAPPAGSAK